MASDRWIRSGARSLVLCVLLLAPSARAEEERRVNQTEMVGDPLPGQRTAENLRGLLSPPTPETRWRGLPEFGRDLFHATSTIGTVSEGPVGPDYVLGPGDQLVVFVSSFADTSFQLELDREGKVFLPRVGTTFLWGLSFADAEKLIQGRLATVLRNARVQVSMGRVRALEVFVLGAVEHPGKVTLTGLATAFNALEAAGGPNALGSMRDIRVLRANREVARLDLYRFLLDGDRSTDPRLQSGDVVFVGLARSRIGVQGAVARPGVYESVGAVTLTELLRMAGGATPFADLARIHIERVDANGGFRLQDLPLDHGHGIDPDSLTLSNYDLLTVLPLNDRVHNVVTLDGYVRHPGEYELTPGLTVAELIGGDRLMPEADLDQAELRRVDPRTFAVTVRSLSLRHTEDVDLLLQPMDAITVFSSARLPQTVILEGEVTRPGSYTVAPGERLSQLLERAGWVTAQGFLPGAIFVRPSAAEREHRFIQEFVDRQRLDLAQQQAQLAKAGDSSGVQAAVAAQASLTTALERQTDPGRVVLDLDEERRWVGTPRDPVLKGGDHFTIPLRPATVTVLGSVMNPGTLMARKNASFGDYLRLAGGASNNADLGRSYVIRASGEAVPKRQASRVMAGDAIVVPPREIATGGFGKSLAGGSRFLIEIATAAALIMAATR